MILLTGAAGFIGSCIAHQLWHEGHRDLVLVDEFKRPDKAANHQSLPVSHRIDRTQLFDWLKGQDADIHLVLHLGARTDTAETNQSIFQQLNVAYSQRLWEYCCSLQIPLIYASSAATYGTGEQGFSDAHAAVSRLRPLNAYGQSKHIFDRWVLAQPEHPPHWYGLKFFNVYGPNEYHKGRMASVMLHTFKQAQEQGKIRLFRSHRPDYQHGEQMRDFVYVRDVCSVISWLMKAQAPSGLYNLGTGQARSFNALARAVFRALKRPPNIEYFDTPADIRKAYQYFTEAPMEKLIEAGYKQSFFSLEAGIAEYVQSYLLKGKYYTANGSSY